MTGTGRPAKSRGYNGLSVLLAASAALLLALVLRELPRNDGVHGDYINIAMGLAKDHPHTQAQMSPLSALAITEDRILSVLLAGSFVFGLMSILTGWWARRRGEHPGPHAGSIAISVALLVTASQYTWIFSW